MVFLSSARTPDSHHHRRAWILTTLTLLAFFSLTGRARADAPIFHEYQVKAAFLYNLINFVHWPDAAFASPATPFVIGIVGTNPFGEVLHKLVAGERANGRPLEIRAPKTLTEASDCHIVYIAKDALQKFNAEALANHPILTVSDTDGFAAAGGMITLSYTQNRVRLLVNVEPARAAGLRISAKLLSIATIYQP